MDLLISIITLIASLVALLVAWLTLRHERTRLTTRALHIAIETLEKSRPTKNGPVQELDGWKVRIRLIGTAPVYEASTIAYSGNGRETEIIHVGEDDISVWRPGDEPLEATVRRQDLSPGANQVWIGVTWYVPMAYRASMHYDMMRWRIHPEPDPEKGLYGQRLVRRRRGPRRRWLRFRGNVGYSWSGRRPPLKLLPADGDGETSAITSEASGQDTPR